VHTLDSLIWHDGGASIRQFRRELSVARLTALAQEPGRCWPLVAEQQLEHCRAFLRSNAAA
jgi:hypothetical protein